MPAAAIYCLVQDVMAAQAEVLCYRWLGTTFGPSHRIGLPVTHVNSIERHLVTFLDMVAFDFIALGKQRYENIIG